MNNEILTGRMNNAILRLFRSALSIVAKNPLQFFYLLKTIRLQKKAASKRCELENQGIHVPPFMIVSVTSKCNLKCKGCYARTKMNNNGNDMDTPELRKLFHEAGTLGISIILIAGGEPLVRKDILELTGEFPDIFFPVFTNGLLINTSTAKLLRQRKNTMPVISIEGFEADTDDRRGVGVYSNLMNICSDMGKRGIVYGASITVTSDNIHRVTGADFVQNLIKKGCKLFFYVEYVPMEEGTEALLLSAEQESLLLERLNKLEKEFPSLFIAFPGDEKNYGGCLAAGRGFIHVNSRGGVEPCPFAPYSDTSLKDNTLKAALQSKFLENIRKNHDMLDEGTGGCALWNKRDIVSKMLH